jgi:nitrate reductase molybdenum cofactor assembly chaperone NarJ/NarW
MARTFKVLSVLLSYPTADVAAAAPEMIGVLQAEKLLKPYQVKALRPLIDEFATGDLYDLQERYVLLFDRTRSLALHMFEHVHGESRERGQAMVDLKDVYERGGLAIGSNELPDYLPVFLEFCATQPLADALELIGQPGHIFAALAERLRRRRSPYAAIFDVLSKLGKADPRSAEVRQLIAEPDADPDDLDALDAAWEDEEIRFGPSAQDQCGGDGLISKLRAARRPAPGTEAPPRTGPSTIITHSGNRIA